MELPKAKFPKGEITINKFFDIMNYGTDILFLQVIDWDNDDNKYEFTKQYYNITREDFDNYLKQWREGELD